MQDSLVLFHLFGFIPFSVLSAVDILIVAFVCPVGAPAGALLRIRVRASIRPRVGRSASHHAVSSRPQLQTV